MDKIFSRMLAAFDAAQTVYLVTVVDCAATALKNGSKLLITDTLVAGTLGDAVLDTMVIKALPQWLATLNATSVDNCTFWSDQLPVLMSPIALDSAPVGGAIPDRPASEIPQVRLALEVLAPQPQLLICGAGHIARALAPLALVLGFGVTVVDDRREFAQREFFPDPAIKLQVMEFTAAMAQLPITRQTAVVIVTRGHRHDEDCLRQLLTQPVGYLGMIGSRRRVQVVREKLIAEGFSAQILAQIYAPIGLDIKARTPQEIALAILAEIVWARNCPKDQWDCRPLSRYRR